MWHFNLIYQINIAILWYFIAIAFGYTVLLVACIPDLLNSFKESTYGDISELLSTIDPIPISVVVPVYNESINILECVDSLLGSTYTNLKIILVNDASTDNTLEILKNHYHLREVDTIVRQEIPTVKIKTTYISKLHHNLTVIDKEHSGIGGTLNVGVNAAETPYFISVDADSIVAPDAVAKLAYAALTQSNLVAVGGAVYILNHCLYKHGKVYETRIANNYATALQTPEYIRSFIFSRTGWNIFSGTLSYSGTSTMLSKRYVVEMGGYDLDNPAQDAEIIINMHRMMIENKRPYKIRFIPSSFAWTDVPTTMLEFAKQRINWQKGLMRSVFLHFKMFMNPRYGLIGLFNYPFFLLSEVLGPIVEFTAYTIMIVSYCLGILDWYSAVALILVSWGFVTVITMTTVLLNFITFNKYTKLSGAVKLFFIVFLETFGFRQYLTICRMWETLRYTLNGLMNFLTGRLRKRGVSE